MLTYLVLVEWFLVANLLLVYTVQSIFKKYHTTLYVRYTKNKLLLFFSACLCSALLQFYAVPWVYFLQGVFSSLSATSLLLSLHLFFNYLQKPLYPKKHIQFLLYGVSILGGIFYIFALGFGKLDPYNLGFGSYLLWTNLLFFCVLFLARSFWLGLHVILLAMAMQMLALHPSTNLWDYLLDANLWLFALFISIRTLVKHRITR